MKNVQDLTAKKNLCTSCGICKSICPKDCIDFIISGGQYVPHVDMKSCSNCGICSDICPGYKVDFHKLYLQANQKEPENLYIGSSRECFIAEAKNNEIRDNGVSGGCITAIVKKLLDDNKYDIAFLVNSYKYDRFLETHPYGKNDLLTETGKSRYVPISHGNMIKYVLNNKDKRVIIVAVSCAVQGFLNVVSKFKLNRYNYLILGLFCDKTMSYNVFEYFRDYNKPKSALKNLYFRTKENGGWPGQVKLEYENGGIKFLPARERMILKDYFQLERCMYCIDKLNQFADISFGDNYTGKNSSKEGNNSVIIRTSKGGNVWKISESVLKTSQITIDEIYKSQHIAERMQNYKFARIKGKKSRVNIYPGCVFENLSINQTTYEMMNKKLYLIDIGKKYREERILFHRRIKYIKIRNFIGRIKRYIARRIRGYNK
jgi:coenzyme F420 hydrogenase subunit beta